MKGLKNALARYTIGEATFLDVLNSQKIKTQARSDLILAIIDYNKAQAQLLF
ncbi:MAG: TolC family protein [Candidatus Melainabacteria bacterium]|nr:MAG: TolC family protein [Candidatus Melainabacteria bacterium]